MSVKAAGKNEIDSNWFKDNYLKYDHLPLKRVAAPHEIAGVNVVPGRAGCFVYEGFGGDGRWLVKAEIMKPEVYQIGI